MNFDDPQVQAAVIAFASVAAGSAIIVGAIIALSGGMDVYAKVRGFFVRAEGKGWSNDDDGG